MDAASSFEGQPLRTGPALVSLLDLRAEMFLVRQVRKLFSNQPGSSDVRGRWCRGARLRPPRPTLCASCVDILVVVSVVMIVVVEMLLLLVVMVLEHRSMQAMVMKFYRGSDSTPTPSRLSLEASPSKLPKDES